MNQTMNWGSFETCLGTILTAQRNAKTRSLRDMRVSLNDIVRHAECAASLPNQRRIHEIVRLGAVRVQSMEQETRGEI